MAKEFNQMYRSIDLEIKCLLSSLEALLEFFSLDTKFSLCLDKNFRSF